MKKYTLLLLTFFGMTQSQAQEDKYLWLEEVDGDKAMEFVNEQNKNTYDELSKWKSYKSIYNKSLEIYNSSDKIATPSIRGKYIYNFWKDKDHVRGIWRRCLSSEYKNKNIQWETLIDIDAMAKKDNVKWVFKGAVGLSPDYNRFLIQLSKGGGDAVEVREFDAEKKQFLKDGFYLEESKGSVAYLDENTLIVSVNFGKGTMTTSGYPSQVKLWKRNTPLKEAKLLYEGKNKDVGTFSGILKDGDTKYVYISRALTSFTSNKIIWKDGKTIELDLPVDSQINGILNNQLLVKLKSDWQIFFKTYKSGSLVSLNMTELLKGKKEVTLVLEPDALSSIKSVATTKNKLIINLLTNVTSHLYNCSFNKGVWKREEVKAPDFGTIELVTSDENSDEYYFSFENFITPSTLYAADASTKTVTPVKELPSFFDASNYEVKQYQAKSKDGTMVPYFMVASKGMKLDGTNPTLVYAYGGFEVSQQPFYAASYGDSWLKEGGVFVLANIRGGGEFGPKWHQDGMKEKRQNVFDDLYAVSEDLIAKKVTTPQHLGVMGGSNGGLLVGVAFTQRPDLYNAVVCEVPLLDMQRYNKLLAGASWMGEYGNPDVPAEWEYIQKYSPYQNVKEGVKYPEVLFITSTRDDRVHPGHARKMAAKMNDMGHKIYYYENIEGGHAGSSTNDQLAKRNAIRFSYLLMKLK